MRPRIVLLSGGLILLLISSFWFASCSGGPKEDDNTLEIWHWMTDRHDTLLKMGDQYSQETGQKIKFLLNAPSEVYTSKVRAAAATGTLPDIYGVLGESKDLANYVKAGLIYNLTPAMEADGNKWQDSFFTKALGMNAFTSENEWDVTPGIYGVPIDVMNIQMLYNRDLFTEAGITKVPETWEEFIQAGEMIVEKTGKNFFVSGLGETWLILSMVRNFAYNVMGEEDYLRTLKGELSYDSANWITVFQKFQELKDRKLLAPGVVTMINKQSERMFATGGAAVTFNGSWCVNVYHGMNPDLKYSAMFYPSISDKFPVVVMGGAGSSFVISEKSSKKEKALAFLQWLTKVENQLFLTKETKNLPSNPGAIGQMPDILNEFADDMESTIHPFLLPIMESPEVDETIGKGIQSLIIGETTPQKLAAQAAKIKTRVLQENG